MQISVRNAAATPATLHVLPQVWGSQHLVLEPRPRSRARLDRPCLRRQPRPEAPRLKPRRLSLDGEANWLFTENGHQRAGDFRHRRRGPLQGTASTITSCTAAPMRSRRNRTAARRRRLCASSFPVSAPPPCGYAFARPRTRARPVRRFRSRHGDAPRRGRRVLCGAPGRPCGCGRLATCSGRRSPACSGPSRSTSSTCQSGSRAIPAIRRRSGAGAAATRNGCTSTIQT